MRVYPSPLSHESPLLPACFLLPRERVDSTFIGRRAKRLARSVRLLGAAYAIWRKEAWTFSLCFYIAGAAWGFGGIVKGLSESG